MNKITYLAIFLTSAAISCNAQKTQERTVSEFNKIKISGAVHVIYTPSDTSSLSVQTKESDWEKVETKVENSTLMISISGSIKSAVYVYVKNNKLSGIEASGATSFKTTHPVQGDSLTVFVTGASDVRGKLNLKKLTVNEKGASTVAIEGTTDLLLAEVSGASNFKSYKLIAKEAVLFTSGAASVKVHVTDKVRATASSASDIKIKGDPRDVTAETSTAANITRIAENSDTDRSGKDTTFLNWKSKKILIIDASDDDVYYKDANKSEGSFKHWRGFSMAVNGYMNAEGGTTLNRQERFMDLNYRRSLNFQFNIIERQINIVKDNVKLVTGFGFDYHLYELANNTRLNADTSYTWGSIDTTGMYAYKRNKLRCTYLQVPLLLEFNTSNDPEKAFHIAFGVIGQFLISSRTKQVLMEGDNKNTLVRKDSYNLGQFAAKAHVNLGYRNWTLFGEYSLTPLFQQGKGPELYPFAAGIRVVPFG